MTRPKRPHRLPRPLPGQAVPSAGNEEPPEPVNEPTPTPMAGPRDFTLGQVLTLAVADYGAGQLFCAWGEFLEVLGYMLGDVPLVEDLNDELDRARPAVLAQYPVLAEAHPPAPGTADATVMTWLADQESRYGPRLALQPIEGPP